MPTSAPGSKRRQAQAGGPRHAPEHLQPPLDQHVAAIPGVTLDDQRVPFRHALGHHRRLDGRDRVVGRAAQHRQQAQGRTCVGGDLRADGGMRARRTYGLTRGRGQRDLAGRARQPRERGFDPARGDQQRAPQQQVVDAGAVLAQRGQPRLGQDQQARGDARAHRRGPLLAHDEGRRLAHQLARPQLRDALPGDLDVQPALDHQGQLVRRVGLVPEHLAGREPALIPSAGGPRQALGRRRVERRGTHEIVGNRAHGKIRLTPRGARQNAGGIVEFPSFLLMGPRFAASLVTWGRFEGEGEDPQCKV